MKRLFVGLVVGAVLLTGCSTPTTAHDVEVVPLTAKLPNGQVVNCVYATRQANDGGIWCSDK